MFRYICFALLVLYVWGVPPFSHDESFYEVLEAGDE